MTEEEKTEIVQRILSEPTLRKPREEEPRRKSPWEALNSGFVLLVFGSVVSAYLVPTFERTARQEEWRRTTLAENAKYRLEMMRQGLQKLTTLGAADPEAMTIAKEIQNEPRMDDRAYGELRKRWRALETTRFANAASVRASLVYFDRRAEIAEALEGYLDESGRYLDAVARYMDLRHAVQTNPEMRSQGAARLAGLASTVQSVAGLQKSYWTLADRLDGDIEAQEKRYEKLDF